MVRKAPRQAEAERNDEALLVAARHVLAQDGAHASVAAIAARAGIGIASLYRRYRTKEELFQHLCVLVLDQWIDAAARGLEHSDAWEGLADYVRACIAFGAGSLGPLAGMIAVTEQMVAKFSRSDELTKLLVTRAHAAGVLRTDVVHVDISLLIEQLGKSSLIDEFNKEGRTDLIDAAQNARVRIIAIALDGLRAEQRSPLPGSAPDAALFTRRWQALSKTAAPRKTLSTPGPRK